MKKKRSWWKKLLLFCFGSVLLLGIAVVLINLYMIATVHGRILSKEEAAETDADCIIVLGAAVWSGNRPSPMLEDRLLRGIALYQEEISDRIIMSGDHGSEYYNEVEVMKNYAVEAGVPAEHIFMDHAGFSTYETMYRAKAVFQAKKVVIVTQKYHLYRAVYAARALGLDAYGVATEPKTYGNELYNECRECLARVKDFIITITKPEPTYLGEPIPVNGTADAE